MQKRPFGGTKILYMGHIAAGVGIYVGMLLKFGMTLQLIEWFIFAAGMLWLSLIDRTSCVLPDSILAAIAANRLVFLALRGEFSDPFLVILINIFSIFIPLTVIVLGMEWVRNKKLIGGGDMKLILVLCLYFDHRKLLLLLAASCLLALVHVGGNRMFRRTRWGKTRIAESGGAEDGEFPFGPFLAAAAMLIVLCAES